MTKLDLLKRYLALYDDARKQSLKPAIVGARLNYQIDRNLKTLQSIASAFTMTSAAPATDRYKAYEAAIEKVYIDLSEGKTKIVGNQSVYDVAGKEIELTAALDCLNLEHKAAIEERNAQVADYMIFLNEPFDDEVKWFTFTLSELEEKNPALDTASFDKISWMIVDM